MPRQAPLSTLLTPSQRRALALVAEEDGRTVPIPDTICPPTSMQTLERRGLIRGVRAGWKITKKGREHGC